MFECVICPTHADVLAVCILFFKDIVERSVIVDIRTSPKSVRACRDELVITFTPLWTTCLYVTHRISLKLQLCVHTYGQGGTQPIIQNNRNSTDKSDCLPPTFGIIIVRRLWWLSFGIFGDDTHQETNRARLNAITLALSRFGWTVFIACENSASSSRQYSFAEVIDKGQMGQQGPVSSSRQYSFAEVIDKGQMGGLRWLSVFPSWSCLRCSNGFGQPRFNSSIVKCWGSACKTFTTPSRYSIFSTSTW